MAPLGSTIIPKVRWIRVIASRTSSSLTLIISFTFLLMIGQVISPMLVSNPSQIVSGPVCGTYSPVSNDLAASSAPSGSVPKISASGSRDLVEMQVPDINPPPPIGDRTASRLPHSSIISFAAVPWPAMTFGLSNGWMNVAPVRSRTEFAVVILASRFGSQRITSAPWFLTPAIFTLGAFLGITMYAGTPLCLAANATACPWLPLLWVQIPGSASSPSIFTALVAPLNLKAPMC